MSERVEWRVVCADGHKRKQHYRVDGLTMYSGPSTLDEDRTPSLDEHFPSCAPHRVQSRTVTTSEWVDADEKVEP